MKIFVLCQGEGKRWGEDSCIQVPCEYKQMVLIDGTPNILRTASMLKGMDYTIVANGEMFTPEQHELTNGHFRTLQYAGKNILEGICQLSWGIEEDLLFLLGDVVFSERQLDHILYPHLPVCVNGRRRANPITGKKAGEIFALFIGQSEQERVLKIAKGSDGRKLWHLKAYAGIPLVEIEGDWTDDIDSPEEYRLYYDALNDLAKMQTLQV